MGEQGQSAWRLDRLCGSRPPFQIFRSNVLRLIVLAWLPHTKCRVWWNSDVQEAQENFRFLFGLPYQILSLKGKQLNRLPGWFVANSRGPKQNWVILDYLHPFKKFPCLYLQIFKRKQSDSKCGRKQKAEARRKVTLTKTFAFSFKHFHFSSKVIFAS